MTISATLPAWRPGPGRKALLNRKGFTLIEMLVAIAVFLLVMIVLLQVIGAIGEIWKSSSGKISAFQNARSAFSTITRTLAQSTLNTYNDYVDSSGNYRTEANKTTFAPARFARASELHFLAGPTSGLIPNASASLNPGHTILFQTPLGQTDSALLEPLSRTVNSVGFYISYSSTDASLLPAWMTSAFGSTHRFRLVQIVEPTESLTVYESTAAAGYDRNWIAPFSALPAAGRPRARVLAEDVCLLVFRPRLSPKEEIAAASAMGLSYDPDDRNDLGTILSPNYQYDSRGWETGYNGGVTAVGSPDKRAALMRNQIPPIVDVAMVSVARRSMNRFDSTSATPPAEFAVPSGLFTDANQFENDLSTYAQQLSDADIRFRVFRTSVELQGAKWSSTPN